MWYWILIRTPNTKTDRKTLQSERETAAVTGTLFETSQGNSNTRHNYSEINNRTKRKLKSSLTTYAGSTLAVPHLLPIFPRPSIYCYCDFTLEYEECDPLAPQLIHSVIIKIKEAWLNFVFRDQNIMT